MISREEAELKAEKLVELTREVKEKNEIIKDLKAELMEYAEIENLNDNVWMFDNGYAELTTTTKYKLAEIPSEFKVQDVAVDVAEKAFDSKIVLSKEGKKMFKEGYPSIVELMIPTQKKEIKVVI